MEFSVDRDLPVPLRTQLQGLIEYGIACGELVPGELLPSVRELAERVGVAPMTVSQVYGDLKASGMIETRPGSGSFVTGSGRARLAARPEAMELHRRIDALIDAGIAAGIRPAELVSLVSARAFYRDSIGARTRIVMIGLFTDATASYSRFIAARLGNSVTVEPLTISAIERDPAARARANSADLAVTFVNRQREVMSLVTNTKVVSISFIPSEETRKALAALDSLARVAVISRFPDFLPIMKAGVQRFAPHVEHLTGATLETPDLEELLGASDVVVFASGAEDVLARLQAGVAAFEYRHAPDTAEIERVLVPLVKAAGDNTTDQERKAS
ncbi:GntR family transcriptional regulator [Mesorhizobium qingshengii]|uniref:DNA-binding transcriptional regulator YhcF, GntR family n=1 Tax=Mesorhizobium qingshengii TaxID=1165689 RepID=A0A1G5ZQ52_9HYPH|nr:GntR family transcriptional regulator [Mesorhizobium qingshengii]SDA96710.1 DNA-binding transcriptional regulator YhcF, GntR family [Mesorhizobium qingshengii]